MILLVILCSCHFVLKGVSASLHHRFERRFAERASLKGKNAKDGLKDAESRSFLSDLVEDTLAILGLPHWAIAENFLVTLLNRFDGLVRKSSQCLSPAHKAMIMDIISSAFLGLVRYQVRVEHLELNFDLRLQNIGSAGESLGALAKLLEVQQEEFCRSFADSSGESIVAPIRLTRSQPGTGNHLVEEQSRQLILNFLANHDGFSRNGGVCRDAFAFFLARWSISQEEHNGDEEEDGSYQGRDGCGFWDAQFQTMLRLAGPAPSMLENAEHNISEKQIEAMSMKLVLGCSLISKLPNRLNWYLLHLINDSKGSDIAKALRVVKDIAILQPKMLHSAFLKRVGEELLLDGENANVRASAVDMLSGVCLAKMKNSHDDRETKETFDALSERRLDISVKVRQSVVSFLQEVARLSRPEAPSMESENFPSLVGAYVNKHSMEGHLLCGRVINFDTQQSVFKVEYGLQDGSSSSQNVCEEVTFDGLKHVLMLRTDAEDAGMGDAERGFVLRKRFISASSHLCYLLTSDEDSLRKITQSCLQELWFTSMDLPPPNSCLEEIIAMLTFCEGAQADSERSRHMLLSNCSCFEILLSQLPASAEARAKQYVDLIFAKILAIQNISPISSPGSGRPCSFNDFDTRARLLQPVLHALKPFAKRMPSLVFPHLEKILPVLSTSELSKDHLVVLRVLRDMLCDVLGGKTIDRHKLAPNVESELLRAFTHGALKLSDHNRWQTFDEIARVAQALCVVVECNRTPTALALLLKIFIQYVSVLDNYVKGPTDDRAKWIPRTLVVAGCIFRYFDLASVDRSNLPEHDGGLIAAAMQLKEKLFVLCVAKFANANHQRERIKCANLHALGSIFVRTPELMLNIAVLKLMKQCLSPEEPFQFQLQVLKNLNSHFTQEEAELVARTSAAAKPQDEGSVELVSDTSTTIMHNCGNLILESSLSPAAKVREEAVKMIKIVLHRGLTASYLCIPYLLAQQCKMDTTSKEAMRVVEAIHSREASRFTPDALWDGVEKAFRLCPSAMDLPLDAFSGAFRLIVSNDKERANKMVRRFLAIAMKSFDVFDQAEGSGSTKRETIEFKHWVAKLLSMLPFQSMDSVLVLIKLIHDLTSALGGSCMEGLARCLEASTDAPLEGRLARWIRQAQCLSVLIQLDNFLQETYSIKPERIRKFMTDSTSLDKTPINKEVMVRERTPIQISIHFGSFDGKSLSMTPQTKEDLLIQYRSLRDLMRSNFAIDGMALEPSEDPGRDVPSGHASAVSLQGASMTQSKKAKTGVGQAEPEASNAEARKNSNRNGRARLAPSGGGHSKKRTFQSDSESSETDTPARRSKSKSKTKATVRESAKKKRHKA